MQLLSPKLIDMSYYINYELWPFDLITNNNYGQYYDKYPRQHTNEKLALKQVTLYRARAVHIQN